MGAPLGFGVDVVFVSARCGSVCGIHAFQCVSWEVRGCSCVARLRRCARRIIQCFGRSVVFGTPVVVQQAVFVQWHVSVSYCGVIPLNMGSLEEAVVVLSFLFIPCSSLHCARVFRRG